MLSVQVRQYFHIVPRAHKLAPWSAPTPHHPPDALRAPQLGVITCAAAPELKIGRPHGAAAGPPLARLPLCAGPRARRTPSPDTAAVGAPPPAQPSASPAASSRVCCHRNHVRNDPPGLRAGLSLFPACAAVRTLLRRAGPGVHLAKVQTKASTSVRSADIQTRAGPGVHCLNYEPEHPRAFIRPSNTQSYGNCLIQCIDLKDVVRENTSVVAAVDSIQTGESTIHGLAWSLNDVMQDLTKLQNT